MSDLPTQSAADNEASCDNLFRIAKYQRWVILALIVNICLTIFIFSNLGKPVLVSPAMRLIDLASAILMIGSVFMLAKEFTNVILAAFSAITMIVPILSLIILLTFNQKATKYLSERGVKVGFFGANPNRIRSQG